MTSAATQRDSMPSTGPVSSEATRPRPEARPRLSVVIIAYDIPRELPRSLYTLSAQYQRDIPAEDFEVIVVDNGSPTPVDAGLPASLSAWPGQFRLLRIDNAHPSPAAALNLGIAAARAPCIGAMIDGARMASPGLLSQVAAAHRALPGALISTLGWYLGYDYQRFAIACGYNQTVEDAMLDSVDWRQDGYQLFSLSAMDESCTDGWHHGMSESNAIFMHRDRWQALGGFDERFDLPGGGLVNLDLCKRALETPDAPNVLLLGEATFHQVHGGTATNSPMEKADSDWQRWTAQYTQIRGQAYANPVPSHAPVFWGQLPVPLRLHFLRNLAVPSLPGGTAPLGPVDLTRWAMPDSVWQPETLAGTRLAIYWLFLEALQNAHYVSLALACRQLRKQMPEWGAPLHLLSLICPWSRRWDEAPEDGGALLEHISRLAGGEDPGPLPSAARLPSPRALAAENQHLEHVLAEHRETLAQQQDQLGRQSDEIAQQQEQLGRHSDEIAQQREELTRLQAEHSQLGAALQQKETDLRATQATLDAIVSSRSWRLTSGLRAAGRHLRKLLGRKP